MITLGQQSQLGIGIAIKLNNQFSGQAAKVVASLAAMKNQANEAVIGAMKNYRSYALGIAASSGVAIKAMYGMAEAGAEFQHKINQVAIVGGKELGKTRKQLSDFATTLDKTFTRSPTEIAGAMFENVKAGITKGLEGITKYQIAVATATDEILEGENGVAFGLNSIMNAMNLSYGEFPRIANAVTAAANASQASVIGLNESMQYFANTAHLSNMGLEETLALIAKLSQSGIRGSAAGTAASNMVNYLEKNVGPFRGKRANKAWAMLGINPDEIAGLVNSGHITAALDFISQRASKMNIVNRKSVLNSLFNIRGERALENLFNDSDPTKTFGALKQQILEGVKGDIAMRQSKAMMNDLQGEIGKFKNQATNFRIAFTEAVGPMLRVMIGVGTKVLGFFTSILKTPIGKVFAGIAMVTIPLIGVLFAFRAAALTAAIALNGFSGRAGALGFSSLFGAGMNMYSTRMGGAAVKMNKAGRAYVAAGQSVNFGGKLFKAGQILPSAFTSGSSWMGKIGNFLGAGSLVSGVGWGAKLAGFAGKALPMLGKLVGFAFKWIPVIGWIWTIVDLLDDIFGIFSKKQVDPVRQYYNNELHNQTLKKLFPERQNAVPFEAWQAAHGGHDTILQTINVVTPDGKKILSQQLETKLQRDFNNQTNFNTIH